MLTIDDRRTRDMDDAFELLEVEGATVVRVAIADVSRKVPPGSAIDAVAKERGHTHYFASGNSPMLPGELSEEKLSLWPKREKKALVATLRLSADLELTSTVLSLETIVSEAKLSYDEIPDIVKGDSERDKMIAKAMGLALSLMAKRRRAGALVFYDLNKGWVTNEDGSLKQLKRREDTIGYILIQELMILANEAVAAYAVQNNIPILFRNHEAKLAAPERQVLVEQIQQALSTPIADLAALQKRTHMLCNRAEYGPILLGHYGLNIPAYTHFTSPIRRYADLVNHQQLRAHLKGDPLPHTQEVLVQLSGYLNEMAQKERDSATSHFKEKAESRARRQLNARLLDGLSPKEFERVVKVEVRSGEDPSEALTEAWSKRLTDDNLPLICQTIVLTHLGGSAGWRALQEASIKFMEQHTESAVSLLAQAVNISGWPEVSYSITQSGSAHAPSFVGVATISINDKSYSATVTCKHGGNSKLIKQKAALRLIECIVKGLGSVEVDLHLPPPVEAAKPVPAQDPNKNPISALMEYSQATKSAAPKYTFSSSGDGHQLTFLCVCDFLGHQVKAQAATKQEAKAAASKQMVEHIHGA